MKILVVSILDIQRSAPNRVHHFIKHLSPRHHICTLCLSDKGRDLDNRSERYFSGFWRTSQGPEVHYFTSMEWSPFLQETLSPALLRQRDLSDHDVLLNYNTLISGLAVAKRSNLPMVYDIADDLPAMISYSHLVPGLLRPAGQCIGSWLVKRNVRAADRVTATWTGFRDRFSIPEEKFISIPNGVDTTIFRKVPSDLRERLGLENRIVLGYVGVLREWVDLEPVFLALKRFPEGCLLIIGDEGRMKETRAHVSAYGIESQVIFTGTVPYIDVPTYISCTDACIIPFDHQAISQHAVPLKLFEYFACEKPVISTRIRGIQQAAGNKIFYADTADEYLNLLKNIPTADLTDSIRKNREFVTDRFDWEVICRELELLLKGV